MRVSRWTVATVVSVLALVTGCGHKVIQQPTVQKPTPHPKHSYKPTQKQEKVLKTGAVSATTGLPNHSSNFFAVMVENSPAARPQTGLGSADIVYEMEAEGTITRYLALFHDHIPPLVGPARSARPYFVQTALDWGAPYIHFGGSPQAYQMLKTYPYPNIDGVTYLGGKYFTRDSSRVAPHNAYLHTDLLPEFHNPVQNGHFRFGSIRAKGLTQVVGVSIDYNSFTQVKYEYDAKTKRYLRYQQGQPDDDRVTGKQIYTDNVIVQYAPITPIPGDPKERIQINLNGPGKAMYFSRGVEWGGTWKRSAQGKIQYFDANGHVVVIHPGKTWIEVVDPSVPVNLTRVGGQ